MYFHNGSITEIYNFEKSHVVYLADKSPGAPEANTPMNAP